MCVWVALSEILRNVALTVAAVVGAILAWRQLSPAALQARSISAQTACGVTPKSRPNFTS
jgi:hypothetical protein